MLRVLLVEDDESDVLFFERALRAHGAAIDLEVAKDGEQAVATLSKGNGQPLPDRIILDLKLPRRSGIEVLTWIRSNPALKHLSVSIMTSSGEPSDLARIRDLGIDEYIVKPVSYQGLLEIVGSLCTKWGISANQPKDKSRQGRPGG
jgi:DNA-binding response OmpR family regulator